MSARDKLLALAGVPQVKDEVLEELVEELSEMDDLDEMVHLLLDPETRLATVQALCYFGEPMVCEPLWTNSEGRVLVLMADYGYLVADASASEAVAEALCWYADQGESEKEAALEVAIRMLKGPGVLEEAYDVFEDKGLWDDIVEASGDGVDIDEDDEEEELE